MIHQTHLVLDNRPPVRLLFDENLLLIMNSFPELERCLFFMEKFMEDVVDDDGETQGRRVGREIAAMFRVLREQPMRVIQTHHGFLDRVRRRLEEMGRAYEVVDNRMPFPLPRLDLMHGFRGSQGRLTIQLLSSGYGGALQAPTRFGKCLAPHTEVLMADGSVKEARFVRVNDFVMGPDGRPCRVLAVTKGQDQMYQVQPLHGSTWSGTQDHPVLVEIDGVQKLATLKELAETDALFELVRAVPDFGAPDEALEIACVEEWQGNVLARLKQLTPRFRGLDRAGRQRLARIAAVEAQRRTSDSLVFVLPGRHNAPELAFLFRSIGFAVSEKSEIRLGRGCVTEVMAIGDMTLLGGRKETTLFDLPRRLDRSRARVHKTWGDNYVGFEIEGESQLFLLGDFTVTHNTTIIRNICVAFPRLTTVITLPGKDLVRQLHADLEKSLPGRDVKLLMSGGKSTYPSEDITVCSIDSLHLCDKGRTRLLIVDEPHAAVTDPRLEDICQFEKARRFAIGATLGMRFDQRDPLIEGMFGPVRARITFREAVAEGSICNIVAFVIRLPVPLQNVYADRDVAYAALLFYSQKMRDILAWISDKLLPPEWQTLVFIKNENQAKFYAKAMQNSPFIAMAKRMGQKERKEVFGKMERAEIKRCLASAIYAQGVTFPDLRVVINMAGGGAYQSSVQKPGRLAQNRPGKRCGVLIDFLFQPEVSNTPDGLFMREKFLSSNPAACLVKESEARYKLYQETGYKVILVDSGEQLRERFKEECL